MIAPALRPPPFSGLLLAVPPVVLRARIGCREARVVPCAWRRSLNSIRHHEDAEDVDLTSTIACFSALRTVRLRHGRIPALLRRPLSSVRAPFPTLMSPLRRWKLANEASYLSFELAWFSRELWQHPDCWGCSRFMVPPACSEKPDTGISYSRCGPSPWPGVVFAHANTHSATSPRPEEGSMLQTVFPTVESSATAPVTESDCATGPWEECTGLAPHVPISRRPSARAGRGVRRDGGARVLLGIPRPPLALAISASRRRREEARRYRATSIALRSPCGWRAPAFLEAALGHRERALDLP